MSDYQFLALEQMSIPLALTVVAAVGYYLKAGSDATRRLRFILHNVAIFVAGIYAILVAPWSSGRWEMFVWPFYLLILGFLVGLAFTLRRYNGPRELHFLQILQLPSALWIWFVGTMTITHDWL